MIQDVSACVNEGCFFPVGAESFCGAYSLSVYKLHPNARPSTFVWYHARGDKQNGWEKVRQSLGRKIRGPSWQDWALLPLLLCRVLSALINVFS